MSALHTKTLVANACFLAVLLSSHQAVHAQQPPRPAVQQPAKPAPQTPPSPGRTASGERIAFPHYADKARGWHWKEVPPEPEPDPEPEAEAPPPPPPPATPAPPPGPKPFSSAWVKDNLPKYLEIAIDDPSPQNVSNYLYLQRFAMDAADRFSSIYQRVATVDPLLDENRARPMWGPAAELANRQADAKKSSLLKDISQKFGIWFFFRSDCAPCHQQAPILATFANLNGFSVLPVSVDHIDMPNNPWKRFVNDRGHAAQLQVSGTPTLFLQSKDGEFVQISDSVIAIEEITRRVIEIAASSKAISEEQYASTRATSKQLMPSPATLTSMPQGSADDPRAVRDFLRSQLRINLR